MADFTEEHRKEANEVLEFFVNLIENSRNMVRYYLSDEIVFDWFGQTVKGEKNVNSFLKAKVSTIHHHFSNALPSKKIGFRETHCIKVPPNRGVKKLNFSQEILSPVRITRSRTPKNSLTEASTSSVSSGDSKSDIESSPAKKFKPMNNCDTETEILEDESEVNDVKIKYLTAEGYVEFHRPSSKKLQPETKWKRPCKLNIAYADYKNINEVTFYMVIYEGNVKCRRNLLKEFEAEEPEN